MLSALSTAVTYVRAEEFSDLRTYDAPDVLRHVMGFGDTPDSALSGPMQKLLDGGFIQAVKMVVDTVGFAADPVVRSRQEIAVATAPIASPLGVIEPGQVAARKFHWEAVVGDEAVVRLTVNWLMGEQNLDPAWTFGPEGQRYEIEVKGNPDFTVSLKGFQGEVGATEETGITATAAHCVNSVPAVCAAAPGSRRTWTCRCCRRRRLPGWRSAMTERRALVLGGGGLAGIAWETGVLLGIREENPHLGRALLDSDVVVGTSAGSAVGAQITGSLSLDELYERQLAAESAEIDPGWPSTTSPSCSWPRC